MGQYRVGAVSGDRTLLYTLDLLVLHAHRVSRGPLFQCPGNCLQNFLKKENSQNILFFCLSDCLMQFLETDVPPKFCWLSCYGSRVIPQKLGRTTLCSGGGRTTMSYNSSGSTVHVYSAQTVYAHWAIIIISVKPFYTEQVVWWWSFNYEYTITETPLYPSFWKGTHQHTSLSHSIHLCFSYPSPHCLFFLLHPFLLCNNSLTLSTSASTTPRLSPESLLAVSHTLFSTVPHS